MTRRQQLFIDNYIKTMNGTKSAILSGYSPKVATVMAYENLRKPHIKEAIDKGIEEYQADISSKDGFIRKMKSMAEMSKHPSVQARYYELIARCKGYIEPDTKQHISIFNSNTKVEELINKRVKVQSIASNDTHTQPIDTKQVTSNVL